MPADDPPAELIEELRGADVAWTAIAEQEPVWNRQRNLHAAEQFRRAADALESRWAADREALAEQIRIVWIGGPGPIWSWSELPEEDRCVWRERADRLLASGAVVRVPRREALLEVISQHVEDEPLADAVLELIGARASG